MLLKAIKSLIRNTWKSEMIFSDLSKTHSVYYVIVEINSTYQK